MAEFDGWQIVRSISLDLSLGIGGEDICLVCEKRKDGTQGRVHAKVVSAFFRSCTHAHIASVTCLHFTGVGISLECIIGNGSKCLLCRICNCASIRLGVEQLVEDGDKGKRLKSRVCLACCGQYFGCALGSVAHFLMCLCVPALQIRAGVGFAWVVCARVGGVVGAHLVTPLVGLPKIQRRTIGCEAGAS